jgi:hypothetical protein
VIGVDFIVFFGPAICSCGTLVWHFGPEGLIAAGISLAISAATSTTLLLRVVISTIALDCLCSYTLLMIEVVLTNCQ